MTPARLWHPKPAPTYARQSGVCRAPGCSKTKLVARNLCMRHFKQQRRNHGEFIGPYRERGNPNPPPPPPCRVADCQRPAPHPHKAENAGLCMFHRNRLRVGIALDRPMPVSNAGTCKVEDCGRKARCRGYCGRHDQHLRLYGEIRPDNGKAVKGRLSKAQWTIIERRRLAGERVRVLATEFGVTDVAVYMHMKKKREADR